ncbi:MAG: desulfoferrodoxin [Alkaliphilus sp.]
MTKRLEIFKCDMCGNIVEMFHEGVGALVCCSSDMKHMEEKNADSTTEKHVPVIEKIEGGYKVIVGSTLHPMQENHYIEWVELIAGDVVMTAFLEAGDKPEATFMTDCKNVYAREYCNVHGLWTTK